MRTARAETTEKEILRAFGQLRARLEETPGSKGLLFFAGHGDADDRLPTEVFLCPSDVQKGAAPARRIALGSLLRQLDLAAARSSLTVVLDCCFGARILPTNGASAPPPVSGRLRPRSLRGTPTAARMALKTMEATPNVALICADDDLAFEAELTDGWVGAFSWAATDAVNRWAQVTVDDDAHFAVTHRQWMATVQKLLDVMEIPQTPRAFPPDLAAFQDLNAPPRPTSASPNASLLPRQLDPGTDGFREYDIEVGGTAVGRIISTSSTNVPANLLPDTEYWEVDLSQIANQNLTIRLVRDRQTSAPTALNVPDRWSARPVADGTATGTLAGGTLTWKFASSGLPAFRIDTSQTETHWVRDTGYGELFAGASVGAAMAFTISGDVPYTSKRFTRDDWGAAF